MESDHVSRTKYWAIVTHESARLIAVIGISIGLIWAFQHAVNDESRFRFGILVGLWSLGLISNFIYYLKLFHVWRATKKPLILIFQETGLELRKANRTYVEPAKAEGKAKACIAWFFPALFGTPAVLMLIVFPLIVFSPQPVRSNPLGDIAFLMSVPTLILTGIAILIWRSKQKARKLGITLTEALYEWHRTHFEINPRKRASGPPGLRKRSRLMGFLALAAFSAYCIWSDLPRAFVNAFIHPPRDIVNVFDMLPWVFGISGVLSFLEELRYDD